MEFDDGCGSAPGGARDVDAWAREIVYEWLQHDVDDFTQSCIADRGESLIERIAAALHAAQGSPPS
jgi:hypothetical protein